MEYPSTPKTGKPQKLYELDYLLLALATLQVSHVLC